MSGSVRGPPTRLVRRTAGQALPTLQSPGCAGLRPASCDARFAWVRGPPARLVRYSVCQGARASGPPRATILRGTHCPPCNHLGARASGPPRAMLGLPGCTGLRPASCDILRGKHCPPCNHLGARASGPPGATYCGASIAYPAITWVRGPPARVVRCSVCLGARASGPRRAMLGLPGCAGLRPASCDARFAWVRGPPARVVRYSVCLGARASGPPGATYCGVSIAHPAITWGRGHLTYP